MRSKLVNVFDKKGFTLIEFLVVIFIIVVLAAVVLVNLSMARMKSRDNRRKSDLAVIQQALEMYYSDEHSFPRCPGWGSFWCHVQRLDGSGTSGNLTEYLSPIPDDPAPPPSYEYMTNASKNRYLLASNLENEDDEEDYNKDCDRSWAPASWWWSYYYGSGHSYHYCVSSH